MDVGAQYKKEIHILSKACDEAAFRRLYAFSTTQGAELKIEIANFQKFLIEEEGISDLWASFICDTFCNVICDNLCNKQVINDILITENEDNEKTTHIVRKITNNDEFIKSLKDTDNDDKAINFVNKLFFSSNPLWARDFLREEFELQPGASLVFGYHNEWKILDVCEDYVVLFNEKCRERQPFNESGKRCFWKNSSLRKWLNDDYIRKEFSLDEIKYLKDISIKTDNQETEDKVFLLSEQEITKYNHFFEKNNDTWLLRNSSPINGSTHVMTYEKGKLFPWGCVMDYKEYVKPVIYVSINYFIDVYIKKQQNN